MTVPIQGFLCVSCDEVSVECDWHASVNVVVARHIDYLDFTSPA